MLRKASEVVLDITTDSAYQLKKLTDKINEAKYKARREMDSADFNRQDFIDAKMTDCDNYRYHTKLWEYYRGQYNLCVELERSYE